MTTRRRPLGRSGTGLEGFQEETVPGWWLNGWAEVCQVSRWCGADSQRPPPQLPCHPFSCLYRTPRASPFTFTWRNWGPEARDRCWGSPRASWNRISRHRAFQKGVSLWRAKSREIKWAVQAQWANNARQTRGSQQFPWVNSQFLEPEDKENSRWTVGVRQPVGAQ